MKKIKEVVKLAKSLGNNYPLQDNYTLIRVSSQLPPYTDVARGVNSLDHFEVRHPYSDEVICALTVWSAKRVPSVVKLGIFQDEHKSVKLIESIHDKLKELYPNLPKDLLSHMYSVWSKQSLSDPKFHAAAASLKRAPLRKSKLSKAFEDHLDYHVYQGKDHIGTLGGKELNKMMPTPEHRDQASAREDLNFHPAGTVSGSPDNEMQKAEGDSPFHNHLDYHVYQNKEHVGTLSGKELNAMMPTSDHRAQTEQEKGFVFHATNTVTGNPASFMKSKDNNSGHWMAKLVGFDGYYPVVDIKDSKQSAHAGGGNIYTIKRPDNSVSEHHQDEIEDLKHSKELAESMPVFMRD